MSAIETAGSTDPEAVREALASTSGFKGVTGTIGFATASRIPSKSVTIMEVDGGRQRFVGEVLPKKVPPPR
jgi:branched-chain amino acid transport system substrate-binding protein